MNEDCKFKIDQKVVYPSQGVGKITDIFEKEFNGKMTPYYKIYLDVSDMIVMIPVNQAEKIGIRPIVSSEDAKKAIELLGAPYEPVTTDWKLRYQMNLELLKKGSIFDIATVVRSLYHRSKIKELPILERKLFDNAKTLLKDEISFSLDKTHSEIENMFHAKLEPIGIIDKIETASDKANDEDEDEFEDEETDETIDKDDDESDVETAEYKDDDNDDGEDDGFESDED